MAYNSHARWRREGVTIYQVYLFSWCFVFSGHGSKSPEPSENKAKVKSSAKTLYGEYMFPFLNLG